MMLAASAEDPGGVWVVTETLKEGDVRTRTRQQRGASLNSFLAS